MWCKIHVKNVVEIIYFLNLLILIYKYFSYNCFLIISNKYAKHFQEGGGSNGLNHLWIRATTFLF